MANLEMLLLMQCKNPGKCSSCRTELLGYNTGKSQEWEPLLHPCVNTWLIHLWLGHGTGKICTGAESWEKQLLLLQPWVLLQAQSSIKRVSMYSANAREGSWGHTHSTGWDSEDSHSPLHPSLVPQLFPKFPQQQLSCWGTGTVGIQTPRSTPA